MKLTTLMAVLISAALAGVGCRADDSKQAESKDTPLNTSLNTTVEHPETITLGAGCFWCTEAVFQQIPGVVKVTSGYMGGTVPNPSYDDVCTGQTGHAEVSQIQFDTNKTSLEKILDVFWEAHDPTSLNRQGADHGTQYRSAIFFNDERQKAIAEKCKAAAAKDFSKPIVTEITQAGPFYPAEDYHQNYYNLNKGRNPYCSAVISPKLRKLHLKD